MGARAEQTAGIGQGDSLVTDLVDVSLYVMTSDLVPDLADPGCRAPGDDDETEIPWYIAWRGVFRDDDSSVLEHHIDWLALNGITRGCNTDGTLFCPDKGITRGQMAAFLKRALGT